MSTWKSDPPATVRRVMWCECCGKNLKDTYPCRGYKNEELGLWPGTEVFREECPKCLAMHTVCLFRGIAYYWFEIHGLHWVEGDVKPEGFECYEELVALGTYDKKKRSKCLTKD